MENPCELDSRTDFDGASAASLRGHVVLTGAGGGLGREMTLGLLRAGARVTALDVRAAGLRQLHEVADDLSERLCCVECDLTVEAEAGRVLERAQAAFGSVDALVNNAGLTPGGFSREFLLAPPKSWEIDKETWMRFFGVNVDAMFFLTRAVVPLMVARGSGRIINVTTGMRAMLRPGTNPYGPSKAAAEALSAIMAAELAGTGVTLNVMEPGGQVDTANVPDAAVASRANLLRADVMVAPLLWLLSAQAAGVSGTRLRASDWRSDIPAERAHAQVAAPIAWANVGAGAAALVRPDWNPQPGD